MDIAGAKKLTYIANTALLFFVLGMGGFFYYFRVNTMAVFTIPTIGFYLLGYVLVKKSWLDIYVWLVYAWIAVYMCIATVSLGFDYGFQLYCMSLIPIIFSTKYMAYKLGSTNPRPMQISIALAICSIICTGYAVVKGPIYVVNSMVSGIFLTINSVAVFAFLIGYSYVMVEMVLNSEEKLLRTAYEDRLTGLYNRHYMYEHLKEKQMESIQLGWIAMLDIDNFKRINDTYGHNCGDYVLQKLCEIMRQKCPDCTLSRWGGEEFLILSENHLQGTKVLEQFRKAVAEAVFQYEEQTLKVTITIGVSNYRKERSLDMWIKEADEKLYYGKNHGKNQVVEEIQ